MRFPLLALCALAVPLAHAASGGPDTGDLVWTDSAEPGGPSHQWLSAADATYTLGDSGTTTRFTSPWSEAMAFDSLQFVVTSAVQTNDV